MPDTKQPTTAEDRATVLEWITIACAAECDGEISHALFQINFSALGWSSRRGRNTINGLVRRGLVEKRKSPNPTGSFPFVHLRPVIVDDADIHM